METDLSLLTEMLNNMDNYPLEDKIKIINQYIIADTDNRKNILSMLKEQLNSIKEEKETGILHV